MTRSPNHCCHENATMHHLCTAGVHLAVNSNNKSVAMETQKTEELTSTAAPETSSRNLPYTPCKIPKTKNRYSFHGESLKSRKVKAVSAHALKTA